MSARGPERNKPKEGSHLKEYIFRMYDIRGVVEEDFPQPVVHDLGRAFGTFVRRQGGQTIALSGDIRLTTPKLKAWYAAGLQSTGIEVIDIGILPTPANYFSMFHMDVDGAVQITGSHNPPDFNGFKMSYKRGAVYGDQIVAQMELINKGDFETGEGSLREVDILAPYLDMLQEKIPPAAWPDRRSSGGLASTSPNYTAMWMALSRTIIPIRRWRRTWPTWWPRCAQAATIWGSLMMATQTGLGWWTTRARSYPPID